MSAEQHQTWPDGLREGRAAMSECTVCPQITGSVLWSAGTCYGMHGSCRNCFGGHVGGVLEGCEKHGDQFGVLGGATLHDLLDMLAGLCTRLLHL